MNNPIRVIGLADLPSQNKPEKEVTPSPGILKLPKDTISIKLSGEGVNTKLIQREGRRRNMEFRIKFSKDEAIAFRNYCGVFKDNEMHMDDFIKFLFFEGMNSYNAKVNAAVEEVRSNPELLEQAGIDPDKVKEVEVEHPTND